jgi:hypothetical protein
VCDRPNRADDVESVPAPAVKFLGMDLRGIRWHRRVIVRAMYNELDQFRARQALERHGVNGAANRIRCRT